MIPMPEQSTALVAESCCSWCRVPVLMLPTLSSWRYESRWTLILLNPRPHPAGAVQLHRATDGIVTANVLTFEDSRRSRVQLYRAHHEACPAAASRTAAIGGGSTMVLSRQVCLSCDEPLPVVLLSIGFAVHAACPMPPGPAPAIAGDVIDLPRSQTQQARQPVTAPSGRSATPRRRHTQPQRKGAHR